jgi:hypothetical protein
VQNLDAHLQDHHNAPKKLRREILESYHSRAVLSPKEVVLPSPLGPPIDELGAPLDGLQCKEADCSFITINIDTMRMHRKKAHNLTWRGNSKALYQKVKVQTFFRAGGLQRYFVVRAAADSSGTLSVPCEAANVVKGRLSEWGLTKQEHEQRAQVMDAQVAKTDKTG